MTYNPVHLNLYLYINNYTHYIYEVLLICENVHTSTCSLVSNLDTDALSTYSCLKFTCVAIGYAIDCTHGIAGL